MKPTLTQTLGTVLRRLREERGLTQQGMADRCGLDRTYINYLEAGTRNPGITVVNALASGLGLTLVQLLKRVEEEGKA